MTTTGEFWMTLDTPDPPAEQVLGMALQHPVGLDADGVDDLVVLQVLVDLGDRERRVGPEIHRRIDAAVVVHDRFEHRLPLMGTRNITLSKHHPFEIAEVVEAEQRVIAGLGEVAVVGRALLVTIGGALGTVEVEDDWAF